MPQYELKPIHHHTPFLVNGRYVSEGIVVTRNFCNIMPGATWFETEPEARQAIRVLEHVKGDGRRFWRLLHRITGVTQRSRRETAAMMAGMGLVKKSVDPKRNQTTWSEPLMPATI